MWTKAPDKNQKVLLKKTSQVICRFKKLKYSEDEMKKEINELNIQSYYINLYNLDYGAKDEDIIEYFKPIPVKKVIPYKDKNGLVDIELGSKEDALAAIEKGSGV
jgi:hypothetical protein